MGNCNFKEEQPTIEKTETINRNLFQLQYVIGRGGFGKVWKVEFKKNRKIFAMKIMPKYKVYMKKSITSILNEKKILENLNHSLIVNMHHAFQDKDNLYLILDYISGGDLRSYINRFDRFDEKQTSK